MRFVGSTSWIIRHRSAHISASYLIIYTRPDSGMVKMRSGFGRRCPAIFNVTIDNKYRNFLYDVIMIRCRISTVC